MNNKPRILVVDDDANTRETLSMIFKRKGYNVDAAKNGQEAIQKSRTGFFNLALLDIKLPDMEGTELLTKMHNNTPQMKKIMITGYASLENAIKSLNLGANAYIMKPVNPEELLKIVKEKLKEQEEAEKMTEEKVSDWLETRVRKLEKE